MEHSSDGDYELAQMTVDELEAARVAANVLDTSAMIRAGRHEISEKLAAIAQKRVELEGSAEGALASEMWLMTDRMYELRNHKWWRRMGKSALSIIDTERRGALRTEPVPDGMIGVHEGKELILSGIVYTSAYVQRFDPYRDGGIYNGDVSVGISRVIQNHNLREASATQKLYELKTYNNEIGRRVSPSGSEFRALEEQKEDEHRATFDKLQENEKSGNQAARMRAMIQLAFTSREPGPIAPPDEMFLKPLALVMQGNMLLGAKRR